MNTNVIALAGGGRSMLYIIGFLLMIPLCPGGPDLLMGRGFGPGITVLWEAFITGLAAGAERSREDLEELFDRETIGPVLLALCWAIDMGLIYLAGSVTWWILA